MTTTTRFAFVVEYVADVSAAKRYYVDVLGLEVERDNPAFVQFRDSAGAGFAIAGDQPLGGRDERELYWAVDAAEAAFDELSGNAEISLPLKQMPFGKVFGVKGPAGQSHYLIEFAQNRPSQRVG
jgi:catechol 2,3-dioxygenase-like lactoylglutathione lyase family enzyme